MSIIVGLDEVGRGPWAGPLVAAAVALPVAGQIVGVKDSKKLTDTQRVDLIPAIKRKALGIGIGWVQPQVIDKFGLTWATSEAMRNAVAALTLEFDDIVIDGNFNYLAGNQPLARTVVKADDSFPCVAAASIIAKVARDNFMKQVAKLYPRYGFEKHVGYGTPEHRRLLLELGPSAIHRFSFKPLWAYRAN